jgi:hypothetical protein
MKLLSRDENGGLWPLLVPVGCRQKGDALSGGRAPVYMTDRRLARPDDKPTLCFRLFLHTK